MESHWGVLLATTLALLLGLVIGYDRGQSEILHRDHVQGKAGIFIDGYDRNKIYRIVPLDTTKPETVKP